VVAVMTGPWTDDDALLESLRAAAGGERDLVERSAAAGRAAFAWRSIDDELAELAIDLVVDPDPGAGAAQDGRAAIRELIFAFRGTTVFVQVGWDSLHGRVVPPCRGEVEVHAQGGGPEWRAEVDRKGFFAIAPLPRSAFRLRWRLDGRGTAVTDRLTL
jgi:hypothetical protein